MKPLFRTAVLALAVTALGCINTDPGVRYNHWNIDDVPPRVVKAFTGYRGPVEGTYWEHLTAERESRWLTMRRHFLNNNPYNPFEPLDYAVTQPERNFGEPPPVKKFKVKNK